VIAGKQVTKTPKRHEQALEVWFRVVPVLFFPRWKGLGPWPHLPNARPNTATIGQKTWEWSASTGATTTSVSSTLPRVTRSTIDCLPRGTRKALAHPPQASKPGRKLII